MVFNLFLRNGAKCAKPNMQQNIDNVRALRADLLQQCVGKMQSCGRRRSGTVCLRIDRLIAILVRQPLGDIWRQRHLPRAIQHLFEDSVKQQFNLFPAVGLRVTQNANRKLLVDHILSAGNRPPCWAR